ncbi:MAG: hypothetical protein E7517_03385 [Ruminococcaceae bacterium]|nr:hypothetical protein [Oscillospiraceae bacterium]
MIQRLKALSKIKKIIIAATALLLCAAIICGICVWQQHSRYACQYAKPFSFSEVAGHEKVKLIAHRGAAVEAPENTLPALEKAAEKGYGYAEFDVRATSDGVWVLSHDDSLNRMTGFRGKVESLPLAEVQAHPLTKGANIKEYPDLVTPTLEEALALCKAKKLIPFVEIKTKPEGAVPYKTIVDLLGKYGLLEQARIISFEYGALEQVRAYNADIRLQLLTKELTEQVITQADKLGGCGIDCEYKALLKGADFAQGIKSAGMELNAWTVDTPQAAAEVCALGVDYMTTNAAR